MGKDLLIFVILLIPKSFCLASLQFLCLIQVYELLIFFQFLASNNFLSIDEFKTDFLNLAQFYSQIKSCYILSKLEDINFEKLLRQYNDLPKNLV